ncbi:MAG: InlB B-repeat-containing protein [Anaeroplasmataceae bacterium]|nr:InlB B-repeat-containing protein [Anaeroplasmataceae bacterium]
MLPKNLDFNEDENEKALEEISNEDEAPALDIIEHNTNLAELNSDEDEMALENASDPLLESMNELPSLNEEFESIEESKTDADKVIEVIQNAFKKKSVTPKDFFTAFLTITDEFQNLSTQDYKNFLEAILSSVPKDDISQYKALYAKILSARHKRIKEADSRLSLEKTKQESYKKLAILKQGIDEAQYRTKEVELLNKAYKTSVDKINKLTIKMDFKETADMVCEGFASKIKSTKTINNYKKKKIVGIVSLVVTVMLLIVFLCVGAIPKIEYVQLQQTTDIYENKPTYAVQGIKGLYLPFHYPMKHIEIDEVYNGGDVTVINEYAFKDSAIESITLPDSIKRISSYAFYGCKNLKNIHTIKYDELEENSLYVSYIDEYAFYGCESLETLKMSTDIRNIGYCAFSQCNKEFKIQYLGSSENWSMYGLGSNLPVEFLKFIITIDDSGKRVTVTPGEPFNLGTAPSKSGYDAEGYYHNTTKVATAGGASVGNFTYTSDIRVTVKYIPKKYSITCLSSGTIHTVEYDSSFTLPVPEVISDSIFVGWYAYNTTTKDYTDQVTDATGASLSKYTYLTNIEVEAHYQKDFKVIIQDTNSFITVKFDSLGGSTVSDQILSQSNPYLNYYFPDRSGYIFAGWYKDPDCTILFQQNEIIISDITLYAGWYALPSDLGYNYFLIDPFLYQNQSHLFSMSMSNASDYEASAVKAYFVAKTGNMTLYFRANYLDSTLSEYSINYQFYNITKNKVIRPYTLLSPSKSFESYTFDIDSGDIICISAYRGTYSNYSNFECYFSSEVESEYLAKYEISYPVVYGESFTIPVIEKEGYNFIGYRISSSSEMLTDAFGASLYPWRFPSNLTVDPVYEPIIYTISYVLNGGQLETKNPTTYTTVTDNIILNNPTKEYYTFVGWYDNAEFLGNPIERINRGSFGDVTLYAKFIGESFSVSINSYSPVVTVFFNSMGGSDVPSQVLTLNRPDLVYPEEPTKEGYVFSGWYEDEDCTKKFEFVKDIKEDMTLYAGWLKCKGNYNNKFSIQPYKYNTALKPYSLSTAKAGTSASTANCVYFVADRTATFVMNYKVYADDNYSLNYALHFEIYNYTQSLLILSNTYTYPSNSYSSFSFTATEGDLIGIYAYKAYSSYTSTLQMYFENFSIPAFSASLSDSNVHFITYDSPYTLPISKKTGCGFDGYYLDPDFTIKLTDELGHSLENWMFTENKEIYPKYTEGVYRISYITNGGAFEEPNVPYSYTEGNSTILLATLTKVGHIFTGWYDNPQFSGTSISEIPSNSTGNKVFYARFTPMTFTITLDSVPTGIVVSFDTDGGSEVESQILTKENPILVYPEEPVKSGYIFGGWYLDQAYTTLFQFEESISNSMILYAKWIKGTPLLNQGPLSINYTSDFIYYPFISPISKSITVYSMGTGDTIGALYDSSKNIQLAYNDDGGENVNFSYTYYVEANTLYYIAVRGFSMSGSCNLCVTGSTVTVVSTATFEVPSSIQTITYGSSFALPVLYENGKEFLGWYLDEAFTLPLTDKTGKCLEAWTYVEDKMVYAAWKE